MKYIESMNLKIQKCLRGHQGVGNRETECYSSVGAKFLFSSLSDKVVQIAVMVVKLHECC